VNRRLRPLLRSPLLTIAVLLGGALCALALLAPWIAPHDPGVGDLASRMLPPVWLEGGRADHWLGTDVLGRDMLSRLLYGARVSLAVAGLVILIAGGIGSFLGILAGYVGGWVESLIMRIVDLAVSLPIILLALLFGVLFGPSFGNIILIISLVLWSQFARLARGETLKVREQDYVELARTAGCSPFSIMVQHVLPNVAGSLMVLATLQVGTVILMEASLSFLGVGVPPPTPAWGSMIAEGRSYVVSAWWLCILPGIAVLVTVLAVNVLGDALTDAFNPVLRGRNR
jgi:peptide/nickel transport system permease protein